MVKELTRLERDMLRKIINELRQSYQTIYRLRTVSKNMNLKKYLTVKRREISKIVLSLDKYSKK